MSLVLVTPAAVYPVSLAEMKTHARIDGTEENDLIEAMIKAATGYAETRQRRQLITATWRLTLDCFPEWDLIVPLPPLQSVSSITYVDSQGATQTLSSSTYLVDTARKPGRITPAYDETWPAARYQANSVTVQFIAGYGAAASAVPETTRHAIKMLVSHWIENREAVITGTIAAPIAFAVDALLSCESFGAYA
ncbi:MAG: head-tail connector protein [Acidobacteriales bacterium]|nr:head-tail connector protein [Terriglobales bacterium]